MVWLLAGAAFLVALLWAGRGGLKAPRREWRLLAAALGVAAVTAGALSLIRGGWLAGLALVAAGLALSSVARAPLRPPNSPPPMPSSGLSLNEARAILGVGPDATREDIQEAHARLIRRIHPDAGGTDGLAAHLNAARDRLLSG